MAEVIAINDSITNGKQDPALHVTNAKNIGSSGHSCAMHLLVNADELLKFH